MKVDIKTDKSIYRPGESIALMVQIYNTSSHDVFIDYRIVLNASVGVHFKNRLGRSVRYPNDRMRMRVIPLQKITEAIRLRPNAFYGVSDIARGDLLAPRPGQYKMFVEYGDLSRSNIAALGFRSVQGIILSNEVAINVR